MAAAKFNKQFRSPFSPALGPSNLSEGVPRSFTLNSNEILEALQEPLQGIVGGSFALVFIDLAAKDAAIA